MAADGNRVVKARPVSRSVVTMTELMVPAYANFGGKVHGGVLLGLMDQAAYASGSRHCGEYCVTVSVDGVVFREPVEVGDLVSLRASVNWVGSSSMLIGIRVEAENVRTGLLRHTNTSFFTMVAKGPDGKPVTVPELLLETREDVKRCLEALKRQELRKRYAAELDDARSHGSIPAELERLSDQRCVLGPGLRELLLKPVEGD